MIRDLYQPNTEAGENSPITAENGQQRPPKTAKAAMRKAGPLILFCVAVLFASVFAINYVKTLQHRVAKVEISQKQIK